MATKPPSTIQELLRKYGFMRQNSKRAKDDLAMLQCSLDTTVGRTSERLIKAAAGAAEFEALAETIGGGEERRQGPDRESITERLWYLLEVIYYG